MQLLKTLRISRAKFSGAWYFFAHAFSWGYRIVSIIRYDSVLPGLSIEPTLIWGHDINGNSPGPGGNFVEGRKTLNSTFQFRYKTAFSFNVSYQLFTGGGTNHLLRDRVVRDVPGWAAFCVRE